MDSFHESTALLEMHGESYLEKGALIILQISIFENQEEIFSEMNINQMNSSKKRVYTMQNDLMECKIILFVGLF